MKRPCSSIHSNDGVYIPLIAIALVTILTVIGLATDSSKLFIEQLRQQRAADAATVAGAVRLTGSTSVTDQTEISKIALELAQDNYEANNISYDASNPTNHIGVSFPSPSRIRVTTTANSDAFVMGRWVQGRNSHWVSGVAAGTRQPVAVALILDVTGSMGGKADPNCTSSCKNKLQALKEAADSFIDSLDTSLDRISITTFSSTATLRYGFQQDFNKAAAKASYAGTIATGTTAIRTGLYTARNDFLDPGSAPFINGFKKVAVLITDGAPNTLSGITPAPNYIPGCSLAGLSTNQKAQMEALAEADGLRGVASLYTIGVGATDTATGTPWQTVTGPNADYLIKEYFLKRIANDSSAGSADPAYPPSCLKGYSDLATGAAGEFLKTPNANDLTLLMARIGRSILTRLDE